MAGCVGVCGENGGKANVASVEVEVVVVVEAELSKNKKKHYHNDNLESSLILDTILGSIPPQPPVSASNPNPTSTAGGSPSLIPSIKPGSEDLPTTGEVLSTDQRFSTLLTALETAFPGESGLEAPFTIFAPTNSAFAKIDEDTLLELLEDTEALQQVLLRHVVAGQAVRIPAGDTTIQAVLGDNININRDINDIFSENVRVSTDNGDARVVQFDILTSDGVIHAIDTVI